MRISSCTHKLLKSDLAPSPEVYRILKYGCEQDASIASSSSILKRTENRFWRLDIQLSRLFTHAELLASYKLASFLPLEALAEALRSSRS